MHPVGRPIAHVFRAGEDVPRRGGRAPDLRMHGRPRWGAAHRTTDRARLLRERRGSSEGKQPIGPTSSSMPPGGCTTSDNRSRTSSRSRSHFFRACAQHPTGGAPAPPSGRCRHDGAKASVRRPSHRVPSTQVAHLPMPNTRASTLGPRIPANGALQRPATTAVLPIGRKGTTNDCADSAARQSSASAVSARRRRGGPCPEPPNLHWAGPR